MPKITAFVARSFSEQDEQKISQILSFLDSFQKSGFLWRTAEPAEVESVSRKVRDMIDGSDVFVGIFTRRHPIYEFQPSLRDRISSALWPQRIRQWVAPPWVIQESGYALKAITSQRKLILFRESGVELPGLQADLEYIEFEKGNFATAFRKASEMINALLSEAAGMTVETIVRSGPPPAQAEPSVVPTTIEREKDVAAQPTRIADVLADMIEAIHNKNWKTAKEAYEKGLDALNTGPSKRVVSWKSLYHKYLYHGGRTEELNALMRLADENPQNPEPLHAIGWCFEQFQEYERAHEYYLKASRVLEGDSVQDCLAQAAGALSKAKKPDRAIALLLDACRGGTPAHAVKAELYSLLKENGSGHAAFAIGEQMLLQNPAAAHFRFSLAYDYDTEKLHELSLFHYRILRANSPTEMGLNNLGVAYSSLNLPILSVESQQAAYEKGNTLAAANLAQRYLDAGFASEAGKLARKAMAQDEPHENLPSVLAAIDDNEKRELESEKSFVDDAEKQRTFLLAFGEGFLDTSVPINGKWSFPDAEITLFMQGDLLKGEAEKLVELRNSLGASLLGGPEKRQEKRRIRFSGKLIGRTCDFVLDNQVAPDSPFFGISALAGTSSRKGHIVFAKDGSSGAVCELKNEKLSEFYSITKA